MAKFYVGQEVCLVNYKKYRYRITEVVPQPIPTLTRYRMTLLSNWGKNTPDVLWDEISLEAV